MDHHRGALIYVVTRAVFAPGRITYHRIDRRGLALSDDRARSLSGSTPSSVCSRRDAFSGLTFTDSPTLASDLIYFSFVTLTTIGYGDIVPVHPLARSLCNLEGDHRPALSRDACWRGSSRSSSKTAAR